MGKGRLAARIVAGIAMAVVAFLVVLFVIKALWAWTVPDLFPGAVAEGLVAGSITWGTAAKIALLAAVISGFFGGQRSRSSSRR